MRKVLAIAAILGLTAGGAFACPYQKTVKTDTMTTASIDTTTMSTPADAKAD